jgi:pimeloyl-ACP methyl ester carboxylesterase
MESSTKAASTEIGPAPDEPARTRRLVVLVPNSLAQLGNWSPLKKRLAMEEGYKPEEAHWLEFAHRANLWSTEALAAAAERLRGLIDAEWLHEGGFDDVVLVGHSRGGLIVREAYLLAAGVVPNQNASDWAGHVSRILLFASVNRGIDPEKKRLWAFANCLARLFPWLPDFMGLDAIRGSHFLANLRINWIRLFGALAAAQREGETWRDGRPKRPPLVVQLLGDRDGWVDPEDSKDVLAFKAGHNLSVPGANHENLYQLDQAPDPERRYTVLREGFVGEFPDRRPVASSARRVVFLLHGILASNVDAWIEELGRRILERGQDSTDVRRPTYGYLSAARFALPSVRRKNIPVFQDWYTEALAEHPTAEFDIIAHSNGTYIFGQTLMKTPGMRFANVVLAGSVLPTNFDWEKLKTGEQVGRVRNDRANRDWPVALLCNALSGLRMHDVGTGGFAGFKGYVIDEVAYYPGGHGMALKSDYQGLLVDFVFGGKLQKPDGLDEPPGYFFRMLSNAMPYVAVLLVLVGVAGLGWYIFQGWEPHPWRALGSATGLLAAYVILDIIPGPPPADREATRPGRSRA